MRTSQIAIMVALIGAVIVPSVSSARIMRLEEYVGIDRKGGGNTSGDATCAALAALGHNVEAVNFSGCNTGTIVNIPYKGKTVSCLQKGSMASLPNGCKVSTIQRPENQAPTCGQVISGYASTYYAEDECPKGLDRGEAIKFCHNGAEKTYYTSCSCASGTIPMTTSDFTTAANSKYFRLDKSMEYRNKSTGADIVCTKLSGCVDGKLALASGDKSTIKQKLRTYFQNIGNDYSDETSKGVDNAANNKMVEIKVSSKNPIGVADGGIVNSYTAKAIFPSECIGYVCIDKITVSNKDSDDKIKKIFANRARVDFADNKNADSALVHANVAEGVFSLPWINKGADIKYAYYAGCKNDYLYASQAPSCTSGHTLDGGSNKHSRYVSGWSDTSYCYKCSDCQDGYSNNALYAASGITSYTIEPSGGSAAFAKSGCEVTCANGYTKICNGSGTACSSDVFGGTGKTKSDISGANGIVTNLQDQFVYSTYKITVPNKGRISCAIATGCNVNGGYVPPSCTNSSWATWFIVE